MDLMTARTKAIKAMTDYGLIEKGWTFEFDRATSRLGQTNFSKKRITVSKHFTDAATEEEFDQTMIHELAHALLPVSAKHGALWKAKARSMGYKGGRTARNPFHEKQIAEKRGSASTRNTRVSTVLVTAQTAVKGSMKEGDSLVMPITGLKMTVQEIGPAVTKAVDAGGTVWKLRTSDALRFLTP
jgi:hypothetical protein